VNAMRLKRFMKRVGAWGRALVRSWVRGDENTSRHKEEAMAEIDELKDKVASAEHEAEQAQMRAERAEAIAAAQLSPELAELVPEGDRQSVERFIAEKIKPLQERLKVMPNAVITNPANSEAAGRARLAQVAALAARGDRKALLEWAALREQLNIARRNP